MKPASTGPVNPWLSIWLRPRDTMRQIVTSPRTDLTVVLIAIAGFSLALSVSGRNGEPSSGHRLLLLDTFFTAAFLGVIGGILTLYVGGKLLHWTGRWLGGSAAQEDIRAAIAWSTVPVVWATLLWIPQLALFDVESFTSRKPSVYGSPLLSLAYGGFGVIKFTVWVWAFVVFLKCLAQVQGFSAWRALGNAVLAAPAMLLLLGIVATGRFVLALVAG